MYKQKVKDAIMKLINDFFIEERGNRLTSNNIEGFALKMNNLLEANKFEKKEDDTKKP